MAATPTATEQEITTAPGKEMFYILGAWSSSLTWCITGGLGALYPSRIIPGFDAACFACTVKAIQQPFYDAAGNLVLPSELHKVFPVGAFVKVHFKIEAIKRTDAREGQPVNSLVRRTAMALFSNSS